MKFPPPVAELVGLELVRASGGTSEMTLEVTERHENPMGTVHGGILCDLADGALGVCWASTLGDGETFTTVELKINFLRPVIEGRLRAIGRVVEMKQTLYFSEADVVDEKGRLIARASSTCMPVPEGQGRE